MRLDMRENTKGLKLDFGATMQKGAIHPMHCVWGALGALAQSVFINWPFFPFAHRTHAHHKYK